MVSQKAQLHIDHDQMMDYIQGIIADVASAIRVNNLQVCGPYKVLRNPLIRYLAEHRKVILYARKQKGSNKAVQDTSHV